MKKKLTAMLAATVVAFALLPALAASAAVNATATMTSPTAGFPGDDKTVSFTVRNNESLLSNPTAAIKVVRVEMPTKWVNSGCPAAPPAGWTCTELKPGQILRFSNSTTGITGGSSVTFNLTGGWEAPLRSDETHGFRLAYAENPNSGSYSPLGTLNFTLQALQVVNGSIKEAAGPNSNPVDDIATAGQTMYGSYQIQSYARADITVTPSITGGDNPAATETSLLVPGIGSTGTRGETGIAPGGFTLTTARSRVTNRLSNVTVDATAPNTDAVPASKGFNIQGEPYLQYVAGSINHPVVSSRYVDNEGNTQHGLSYEFRIQVDKKNIPTVSGATGSITLTGPGGPYSATLNRIDWGTATPWSNSRATLVFNPITINATADDGVYNAEINLTGTDSNNFAYVDKITLFNLIALDNLAPIIEALDLAIPAGQEQAKTGDDITITGTVRETGNGPATPLPQYLHLELCAFDTFNGVTFDTQPDDANAVCYVVPDEDIAVSQDSGDSQLRHFSATVTMDEETVALPAIGRLDLSASVADRANNGNTATDDAFIDNLRPELLPEAFAAANDTGQGGGNTIIRVEFTNEYPNTVVGGCSPAHYQVDGATVLKVLVNVEPNDANDNGYRECRVAGTPQMNDNQRQGKDNVRILVLARDIDPYTARSITYVENPTLGSDPLVDGAINTAVRDVANILSTVLPDLPTLVRVDRYDTDANDGSRESAVRTGDPQTNPVYWVNRGGDPSSTTVPRVLVDAQSSAQVVSTWVLEVTDASGALLWDSDRQSGDVEGNDGDDDTIDVPMPTSLSACPHALDDGNCVIERRVRYRNPNGAANFQIGPERVFHVVLDMTLPTIAATQMDANGDATATWSEQIYSGDTRGHDWFTWQLDPDSGDPASGGDGYTERPYQAYSATRNNNVIFLDVDMPTHLEYLRVEYDFDPTLPVEEGGNAIQDPSTRDPLRYDDFAGNRASGFLAASA